MLSYVFADTRACLINSGMYKSERFFRKTRHFFEDILDVFQEKITQDCGKRSASLCVLSFFKQALVINTSSGSTALVFIALLLLNSKHRPRDMVVEEGDQRPHEESGDDRADADRAEDFRNSLTGDQQQYDADQDADKVADHPTEREPDHALPL